MTTDHPDFDASRTIAALGDTIARLTRERDEARAEIERLREGLASLDCTCIGPVPTGDDPALYRCTRCAALRGEEG